MTLSAARRWLACLVCCPWMVFMCLSGIVSMAIFAVTLFEPMMKSVELSYPLMDAVDAVKCENTCVVQKKIVGSNAFGRVMPGMKETCYETASGYPCARGTQCDACGPFVEYPADSIHPSDVVVVDSVHLSESLHFVSSGYLRLSERNEYAVHLRSVEVRSTRRVGFGYEIKHSRVYWNQLNTRIVCESDYDVLHQWAIPNRLCVEVGKREDGVTPAYEYVSPVRDLDRATLLLNAFLIVFILTDTYNLYRTGTSGPYYFNLMSWTLVCVSLFFRVVFWRFSPFFARLREAEGEFLPKWSNDAPGFLKLTQNPVRISLKYTGDGGYFTLGYSCTIAAFLLMLLYLGFNVSAERYLRSRRAEERARELEEEQSLREFLLERQYDEESLDSPESARVQPWFSKAP